jgi:hypothetical protein
LFEFEQAKIFSKRGRKNDKKEKESPLDCRLWQKCKAVPVNF